ncbi:nucleoside hydrolase-like domain-containing protein [Posidoniimonas polymericola]|uniref:nucleoside hydrolase-like domain-containing protein n=1 Tax=Posidoniimonas polymericola TaxID=2528002 RepID=UPI0011B79F8A
MSHLGNVACLAVLSSACLTGQAETSVSHATNARQRPRILVTSDGEIDDECSMVRFLLYANEWDRGAELLAPADRCKYGVRAPYAGSCGKTDDTPRRLPIAQRHKVGPDRPLRDAYRSTSADGPYRPR